MLSFANWPARDRERWAAAFRAGDRFDESGCGAHLADTTRKARQESCGRFLGFLSANHPDRMSASPEAWIDRSIVAEYVSWRSCSAIAIAIDLQNLRGALSLICPDTDWSWLLAIARRIEAGAPPEDEISPGGERSSLRAGDRAHGPRRRRRRATYPDRACVTVSRRPAHSFPGVSAVAPSYARSAAHRPTFRKSGRFLGARYTG